MSLQRTIVRLLLNSPMSLADLQLATQVSLPTLRRAVQELTDASWIRIVGQAEANGGRPAMLFGVDDSHYAIVGVHLQLPGLRLILSDLTGQVLDMRELFDNSVPTPDESVQAAGEYVAHIRTTLATRQILGVGVATPGFIDLKTGDILAIGRVPAWESFPMRRRLEGALNLPVRIANDVDCMAFAELHYSRGLRAENLVYIGFDEGVKASIFLRGDLYKSTLGNAGLVAAHLLNVPHLPHVEDVARLLTINGMNAIFEERMADLDSESRRRYTEIAATASPRERVQRILENACAEMPICYAIVQEQIEVLAAAIANVILLIQPNVVVIGGLLSVLPPELFLVLETTIRRHAPALVGNNTIIQQGNLATQSSAAIGANHHFLQVYLAEGGEDL